MRLAELVETSNEVARSSGRLDKTSRLAVLLGRLRPEEIPVAVAFLSGSLLQGRIGLGWSALVQAQSSGASQASALELQTVNERFEQIARVSGGGSAKQRAQLLRELFQQATSDEQSFLVRLISGELRQGALEGVLSEAIARAAGTRVEVVRRAAMMCGDLTEVARVALTEGPDALSRYVIQLFRPVQPMLAPG
jgi:DNA ligase-1